MHPPLYQGSVPVFLHYLDRAALLVERTRAQPDLLTARLAPDMFTGAQQFASAAGFALRTACPLAGAEVPDFPSLDMEPSGILARFDFARDRLSALDASEFRDDRRIRHRAGFAELDQSPAEFLHLFGMPNFLFHLGMGFAVLRQGGLEIGKSDFDGFHDYPPGFRF